MSVRSIWITGARGFIGAALSRARAAAGDVVHGLGHGEGTAPPDSGLSSWTPGELDAGMLDELLRRTGRPEVIYHLAGGASVRVAEADPESDFRRTVECSARLLEWVATRASGAPVVLISSAAVYGEAGTGMIAETTPARPVSVYGRHKAQMEDLARDHAARGGGPAAIARLFSVHGPGLRKQLLWDLSMRLAGRPDVLRLGGGGQELRDWTAVSDVCAALPVIASAAAADCPTINVGRGLGVPVRRVAELVMQAWGGDARLEFTGVSPPGDPFSLVADPSRLVAMGCRCDVTIETGVAAYVAWSRHLLAGMAGPSAR